jgi:hypothetical protein
MFDETCFCVCFQKLEQNWKTGCCTKNVAPLGDGESNFNGNSSMKSVIAMDSTSIAVGCPSGLINIFGRKDLSRQKVIQC